MKGHIRISLFVMLGFVALTLAISQFNNSIRSGAQKSPEVESFILSALLENEKKVVFKFSGYTSVGFGWSRKGNLVSNVDYKHPLTVNEKFYIEVEEELNDFLPQFKETIWFGVDSVSAKDEMAGSEPNNVKIRIVATDLGGSIFNSKGQLRDKPEFIGYKNMIVEDDPLMREDVIDFHALSPFLRGYAYFDQANNIYWAVCEMWPYMAAREQRAAMRECIVRSLGLVGKLNNPKYFSSSGLPNIIKQTLAFLYCSEVKSGMGKEDLLRIMANNKCKG